MWWSKLAQILHLLELGIPFNTNFSLQVLKAKAKKIPMYISTSMAIIGSHQKAIHQDKCESHSF